MKKEKKRKEKKVNFTSYHALAHDSKGSKSIGHRDWPIELNTSDRPHPKPNN